MIWLIALLAGCTGDGGDDEDADEDAEVDRDADQDGYTSRIDCDDGDPEVHPDAVERCNAVDDDCDGRIDAVDDSLVDGLEVYADADGDGHGDPASLQIACAATDGVAIGDDCDDADADARPDGIEQCGDGVDQDCDGADEGCGPLLPMAPTSAEFGWQGLQTAFLWGTERCTGSIALAMGDQAMCYVDDGELYCAGRVYTETYGATFTSTGLTQVTQVWLVPTTNVEDGNGACALADGVPTCLAYWNFSGQLGTGGTTASAAWTPWVAGTGLEHLASGTSDQYCGEDASGQVWCAGYGFGETPSVADTTADDRLWIDPFGELHVDEAAVLRVSQGRSECTVRSTGLECPYATWGRPGHVVDGGVISAFPLDAREVAVWLEDDGAVYLGLLDEYGDPADVETRFTDQPVLAIAYNYYTDTVCGVYQDGSLVCFGSNDQGKLGNGSTSPLAVDTVVQPPGTFDPRCAP